MSSRTSAEPNRMPTGGEDLRSADGAEPNPLDLYRKAAAILAECREVLDRTTSERRNADGDRLMADQLRVEVVDIRQDLLTLLTAQHVSQPRFTGRPDELWAPVATITRVSEESAADSTTSATATARWSSRSWGVAVQPDSLRDGELSVLQGCRRLTRSAEETKRRR